MPCRIYRPAKSDGAVRNKQYDQLKPPHQDGVIYAPVENTKISIRHVITREEANTLINLIPTMRAEVYRALPFRPLHSTTRTLCAVTAVRI